MQCTEFTHKSRYSCDANGSVQFLFQNLKPSLVNAVRLKGSVKPISVLTTGLPTSEDITHVDLKFLKAPPLVRKQRNELFIGVFSTGNNFDRRMAVRRSWMQFEAVRSGNVTVRFFVGQVYFGFKEKFFLMNLIVAKFAYVCVVYMML